MTWQDQILPWTERVRALPELLHEEKEQAIELITFLPDEAWEQLASGNELEAVARLKEWLAVSGAMLHADGNPKEFKEMDAVIPRRFFYVEPPQLDQLLALAKKGPDAYSVVYGGRSMGKSTLAQALQRELQKQGYLVHLISLGDAVPKDEKEFYSYLGALLTKCSPDRFPASNPIVDRETFEDALQWPLPPNGAVQWRHFCQQEFFLIDDASMLAKLPDDVLRMWLETITALKGRAFEDRVVGDLIFREQSFKHNVRGVILFGTRAATNLLCNSRPGKEYRASPFLSENCLSMQHFTQDDVKDLLSQYVQQQDAVASCSPTLSEESARLIAAYIHKSTNGIPGLVGICCRMVSMHKVTSGEQWDRFSSGQLVAYVTQHAVFRRDIAALGSALNWREREAKLSRVDRLEEQLLAEMSSGVHDPQLSTEAHASVDNLLCFLNECFLIQEAEEMMVTVVTDGHLTVEAGVLPHLGQLLNEGLITVSSPGDSYPYPDTYSQRVRLEVPAPLFGECVLHLLRTQAISISSKEQPPRDKDDEKIVRWLTKQYVRTLNMDTLAAREAQKAKGVTAEYAFQSQFCRLMPELLRMCNPMYQLLAEGRKLVDLDNKLKRLDFLASGTSATGRDLPKYAWEFLSSGTSGQVAAVKEHVERAAKYLQLHEARLVYVVNFIRQGRLEDLYQAPCAMPEGVKLVHVLLHPDATEATMVWAANPPGRGTSELVELAHPKGHSLFRSL